MTPEPGPTEPATPQRGRRTIAALARAGRKLGFEVAHKYPCRRPQRPGLAMKERPDPKRLAKHQRHLARQPS